MTGFIPQVQCPLAHTTSAPHYCTGDGLGEKEKKKKRSAIPEDQFEKAVFRSRVITIRRGWRGNQLSLETRFTDRSFFSRAPQPPRTHQPSPTGERGKEGGGSRERKEERKNGSGGSSQGSGAGPPGRFPGETGRCGGEGGGPRKPPAPFLPSLLTMEKFHGDDLGVRRALDYGGTTPEDREGFQTPSSSMTPINVNVHVPTRMGMAIPLGGKDWIRTLGDERGRTARYET